MKQYLEAGLLCAPRGIKGELKFDCWCDSPDFLRGVVCFYLDSKGEKPLRVKKYFPSIPSIVFEGYEDRGAASVLTGRKLWFDRADVSLPDGVFFNDDLLGLPVFDADSGAPLGTLAAIEDGARHFNYRIKGEKEYLLPAVEEFVISVSLTEGIRVHLLEGMEVG